MRSPHVGADACVKEYAQGARHARDPFHVCTHLPAAPTVPIVMVLSVKVAMLAAMVLSLAVGCGLTEDRAEHTSVREASRQEALADSIEQLTSVGDIVTLADARFSRKNAESSLWRPVDAIVSSPPGVYFIEPYDPQRIPVLFVHGIAGSPANFSQLIERLDRRRFQPWVYSYPSGARLSLIADHLTQTMQKIEAKYHVVRFVVVGHSMGGLVARGFLLRHRSASTVEVPLFISISTPWAGHAGAELGVEYAPVVLDVWRDMAPRSEYLASLFAAPLGTTTHHLIFTFARKNRSVGEPSDGVVTVASQLRPEAQVEAARLHGIDDTHDGVLRNPETAQLLNQLLDADALASADANVSRLMTPSSTRARPR